MRRVRFVTALFTKLLMIHLAIVGGTMACAMGDGPMRDAGAMPAMTHAAHGSHAPTAASHQTDPGSSSSHHPSHDCETSCAPAACAALGHCASAVESDVRMAARSDVVTGADPFRSPLDAPSSVSRAPATPPPRV